VRLAIRQGLAVAQHDLGPRVGHHVLDLGLGEAGVDGDGHGAGHLDAPEGEGPRDAVAHADGDAVARLHAGGAETAGDASAAVPVLLVRQALAVDLDQRLPIGVGIDLGAEQRHERRGQVGVAQDAGVVALDAGVVEGAQARLVRDRL
jgi:hypothetical protein